MKLWLAYTFLSVSLCLAIHLTQGVVLAEEADSCCTINKTNREPEVEKDVEGKDGVMCTGETAINYDEVDQVHEGTEVVYTAAVLEYKAYDDLSAGGLFLLQENARILLDYATQAWEQGANIIVYPEYGLTSTHLDDSTLGFLSQTQIVPAVKEEAIPCYYTEINNYTKVMQQLSCGAIDLGMYLVVNLAEQVKCSDDTNKYDSDDDRDAVYVKDLEIETDFNESGNNSKVCPELGYIFYNTQVVFDHLGKVVARYRKKHLFLEPHFTPGDQPDEEAIFDTHFGVSFTLQICFDIMFESPATYNIETFGVKDVAMSTAWIDELPYLTAPQVWKGWSEGNKVNLLVANYHDPTTGKMGSGLFRGFTSEWETYHYNASGSATLLVGKVLTTSIANSTVFMYNLEEAKSHPKHPGITNLPQRLQNETDLVINSEKTTDQESNESRNLVIGGVSGLSIGENHTILHENLGNYNHSLLERPLSDLLLIKTLCHDDGLCCTLAYTYRYNETEEGLFMIFSYSGIVEKGGGVYAMYTQTCAVVYCLNDNITSCAHIEGEDPKYSTLRVYELSGTFASSRIYPSVFTQSLQLHNPADWVFTIDEHPDYFYGALNCHEKVENLLSLTLFSRWYAKDP